MKKSLFTIVLVLLTCLLNAQSFIDYHQSNISIGKYEKNVVLTTMENIYIAGEIDAVIGESYSYLAMPNDYGCTYYWEIEKDDRCTYSISGNRLSIKFNQGGVYHIYCTIYNQNMQYIGTTDIEVLTRY